MTYFLYQFKKKRPNFETTQENTIQWLIQAHSFLNPNLKQEIEEKFFKVGCGKNYISKRGHIIDDYHHLDFTKMKVYNLKEHPSGVGLEKRQQIYNEWVTKCFEEFYLEEQVPPCEMIHISCTGYISPSGAQKLVSKKGWGKNTCVTHAYHMGCYASIPAIRMAMGSLHGESERVDLVHTEVCSLHINPNDHSLDKLVAQTLFADGFIRYSLIKQKPKTGFKLLKVQQEIVPDSENSMTWNLSDWGFNLTLKKDVPIRIARNIQSYLQDLYPGNLQSVLFAVHPGGPKILEQIQQWLGIKKNALRHSYDTLYEFGNMSSATLPHIWQKILEDDSVQSNTPIISLAFGPGLTICGTLMEKV